MRYLDIKHCDMVNGSGFRTTIWIAGCERKCPGCFSPHTHSFDCGLEFDWQTTKEELFQDSAYDWNAGITILGGEPLHPRNFQEVLDLVKQYKLQFPAKTIWLYTGYCWNEILANAEMTEIVKYVDVICDGPFVESLKSVNLHWVGSSNQHVIDVKKRLEMVKGLAESI